MRASRSAIACSNRRAPSRSSSSLRRTRPLRFCAATRRRCWASCAALTTATWTARCAPTSTRLFSALRLAALWQRNAGDLDGARAAMDEAAALIEPDWPAEFHIVVLRFHAFDNRVCGEFETARRQYAEGLRLARDAGDWRLEVIERANAADLRWEMGEHEVAARELDEIFEAIRQRPASDFEAIE